ncbi:MAG: asparagine synthase (glutamine-hydrolyzing) [Betaproteobacteria bacterium]|nr:asparagine synthase (glutamine-hydrolyzing) [Betaproteobacteria bacterium]
MCGIVGAVVAGSGAPRLEEAVASLHHRGPDDRGIWREAEAQLGFARLSIIDLSASGHQPMASPDGRYVIVFNGEIYNFPELRSELDAARESFCGHSDTEVLLRVFAREGLERTLAKLRGMFAFAVWDRQERTLSLARDRLGVKPLVYAETAGGFIFASEIQALFALDPALSRDPDFRGLDHFLTFQYIPAPMSGFAAIRKLPPAHAMTVKNGRVLRIFRYWDLDRIERSSLGFAEACEGLRDQVLEATRLRLVSDVPLGAFLSGGIDSSITVAAMARLGASPLKTFSIGFEDERFNELPFAREVALHLGTDHREMMVKADAVSIMPKMIDHLGEPLADNSVMPTFYVSQFARTGVTVALTGDGGDEVFAGYRRFYQIRRLEWLAKRGLLPLWRGLRRVTVALEDRARPGKRRRSFPASRADEMLTLQGLARYKHLLAFFTDQEKASVLTPELRERIGRSATTDYLGAHFGRAGEDVLNRYLSLDLTTYLPEDILFKVDITSMANSLECRSPFLDHKLIEFAASLPGRYKLSAAGRHKHILKEAFADWLPRGFMDRPKKGFSVPLSRWLKDDLADVLRDSLVQKRTLAHWFRQDVVERYVEEHVSGRASHSTKLWPLLILATWVERFRVNV